MVSKPALFIGAGVGLTAVALLTLHRANPAGTSAVAATVGSLYRTGSGGVTGGGAAAPTGPGGYVPPTVGVPEPVAIANPIVLRGGLFPNDLGASSRPFIDPNEAAGTLPWYGSERLRVPDTGASGVVLGPFIDPNEAAGTLVPVTNGR